MVSTVPLARSGARLWCATIRQRKKASAKLPVGLFLPPPLMSRAVLPGTVRHHAGVVVLALLTGCGVITSVQPHTSTPGTYPSAADVGGPARVGGGADSGVFGRPRSRVTRGSAANSAAAARRQCRTAAVPRGWIAVAYESTTSECPGRPASPADSAGAVAVLVRYDGAPVGTRLDVCVDQPIPSGWSRARDEAPGDPGACPGAARNGDTVQRIRRDA